MISIFHTLLIGSSIEIVFFCNWPQSSMLCIYLPVFDNERKNYGIGNSSDVIRFHASDILNHFHSMGIFIVSFFISYDIFSFSKGISWLALIKANGGHAAPYGLNVVMSHMTWLAWKCPARKPYSSCWSVPLVFFLDILLVDASSRHCISSNVFKYGTQNCPRPSALCA